MMLMVSSSDQDEEVEEMDDDARCIVWWLSYSFGLINVCKNHYSFSLSHMFHTMGNQGTRIIMWENDQGELELDFDTDPHDIQIRGVHRDDQKIAMAVKYPNSRHFLTSQHLLQSYVSILYLRQTPRFRIVLREKDVEFHDIVNDMMLAQEVTYNKQTGLGSDAATKYTNMVAVVRIGFVKDAKDHIDVHGFIVYHKNRLIKKESIVTCSKCLGLVKNEDTKALEEFKQEELKDRSDTWTDTETLLLLESVLLHGGNWDLVAERIGTKSKFECISKLIDLPFGELMLSTTTKGRNDKTEPKKTEDDGETEAPAKKRKCIDSLADVSESLMRQIAELCTVASPHIAAVAADSAITALCEENPCARMLIEGEEDSTESGKEKNSAAKTLQIRTAIATAFGAAAAHAKLLADQEDREIEHLVATVIDTQIYSSRFYKI